MAERIRIGGKVIDFDLLTWADLDIKLKDAWDTENNRPLVRSGVTLHFVGGGSPLVLEGAEASAVRQYLASYRPADAQGEPIAVELPARAATYSDDEIYAGLPAELQAAVRRAEK